MERLYLDMCSLKRPFDDQRQPRVRTEASAVAAIIARDDKLVRLTARLGNRLRTTVTLPPTVAWGQES